MKKPPTKNILVSVPVPILKKIETLARHEMRSRTAEICHLLEQGIKAKKAVKAEVAA